jgi:hypothetical protein
VGVYGLHTKRGREIEFSLDAQYSRGPQLITDTGWEGAALSLIKLAKDWEWDISHSDGLVFTTLWPTAIFLLPHFLSTESLPSLTAFLSPSAHMTQPVYSSGCCTFSLELVS